MIENFEYIELFHQPALFSNFRIDRTTVPSGWHCYDIRSSDYDPGRLITLEMRVGVNYAGTILSPVEISFIKEKDYRHISGKVNFLGKN